MSVQVDVSKALTTELNETSFVGADFKAERVHARRQLTAVELEELRVDVVPVADGMELVDRGDIGHEVMVDVFLRRKMGRKEQEPSTGEIVIDELDQMDDLAEAIITHFAPFQGDDGETTGRLAHYDDAAWVSGRKISGYVNDSFAATRICMAQIRFVFTV